jgi:hypothetical protein
MPTDWYVKGSSGLIRATAPLIPGLATAGTSSRFLVTAGGGNAIPDGSGEEPVVWDGVDSDYNDLGLTIRGNGYTVEIAENGEYLMTLFIEVGAVSGGGFTIRGTINTVNSDPNDVIAPRSTSHALVGDGYNPSVSVASVAKFLGGDTLYAGVEQNGAAFSISVVYASLTITKLRSITGF